ncbi:M28 family metallopeptidase [Azospirillum argentinense]|uniref:Peptidase M28 domain-containing protein n=1 Tax=Azospirillum argentinense TaxID=2970906 RepID=A0A5B0KL11_9PROT|nr:M28 family metallopeptidase [Azospirillum argentinense]KAA1052473.1 Aminopeptidase Y (Arg, Lys, Leu preference) [Azospirillum argentinense]
MTSVTFMPLSLVGQGAPSDQRLASAGAPIIFGREAVFMDAPRAGLHAAARLPQQERTLAPDHVLAAVVQKGRLFERAYPEVTVLRNRGRYLLVELSPNHPALVERHAEPCYAAFPVEPGTEVFRDLGRIARPAQRSPAVASVLERLSVVAFRATLEELVAQRTRFSTSEAYRQAAELSRRRLEDLGYQVALQEFAMAGGRSCNVLATPKEAPFPAVIIMGHLDSINHAEGPEAAAPGADDNGSGAAGVIAMADALAPIGDRLSVGFALFGGEEQGLFGSRHMLSALPAEAVSAVRAMINMDMIGTLNPGPDGTTVAPAVLLEGADVSRHVIEGLAAQAAAWTDLTVQTSFKPYASDHVPFIEAGMPAVLTIEGADQTNDSIHGPGDTIDRIDDGLAYQILRMNTAYVASLADT